MDKVFFYGFPVTGKNFIGRQKEIEHLMQNMYKGINSIITSSSRMGKTSLVQCFISELKGNPDFIAVHIDLYDCRSEGEFYHRYAVSFLEQTDSNVGGWIENCKVLNGIIPQLSIKEDTDNGISLSLDLSQDMHDVEQILCLPQMIARKFGKRMVVCIDNFQQIGLMKDALTVQKRLRQAWQHQENCTFCLSGSKKHLMTKLFQDERMPFYRFGEMLYLKPIPTPDWIDFIQSRFASRDKQISTTLCRRICEITQNYSSYVQQLAWNVFVETDKVADEGSLQTGISNLMEQCTALFQEKVANLTSYQMNMLRAIVSNIHTAFASKAVSKDFGLGSKSNISRLQSSLIEKELIESKPDGLFFADPIFEIWFTKNVKHI